MRYIAVFHSWFMKDSSFSIVELDVASEEEAHKEAAITAHRRNSWSCNHCDYVLVPIGDQETLITQRKQAASRKLSLKERLCGKINCQT